ncbi:MAG: hypothetical protein HY717_01630 [Planctomycetes bacterium]|nr:hypothetical protein [Planctomycetota bacterium]
MGEHVRLHPHLFTPEKKQKKYFDQSPIKLRAERKTGKLLRELPKFSGRPSKKGLLDAAVSKLKDLGIEKTPSHRWQAEASASDEQLEELERAAADLGFSKVAA